MYPALNLVSLPCSRSGLILPHAMFCFVLSLDQSNITGAFLYLLPPYLICYTHSTHRSLILQFLQSQAVLPNFTAHPSQPNKQLLRSYWMTKHFRDFSPPTISQSKLPVGRRSEPRRRAETTVHTVNRC